MLAHKEKWTVFVTFSCELKRRRAIPLSAATAAYHDHAAAASKEGTHADADTERHTSRGNQNLAFGRRLRWREERWSSGE